VNLGDLSKDLDHAGVDAGGGFIEQEQAGVGDHRAREREHLALAGPRGLPPAGGPAFAKAREEGEGPFLLVARSSRGNAIAPSSRFSSTVIRANTFSRWGM